MEIRKLLIFIVFVLFLRILYTQNTRLPIDKDIRYGKLENGLTYYIKHNAVPGNNADFRFVIKAGSLQENDDQLGLAHFTEHLAFNGTQNFPDNTLVEYLSSIGQGFHAGLTAFTAHDRTSFRLTSNTDDANQLDKVFLILSDWANKVTFTDEAIDKERGIILEELRLRNDAINRYYNSIDESFGDTLYIKRKVIGTAEILRNFQYQTIKDFYQDWYRPDLQAVIAVGDFDIDTIEGLIIKYFDKIPAKENPREKIVHKIPSNVKTYFVYHKDSEYTENEIIIFYKHPATKIETVGEFKEYIINYLISRMIEVRFDKIANVPNSSILRGSYFAYNYLHHVYAPHFNIQSNEDHLWDAFETLFTEIKRIKQHGFHSAELEAAKQWYWLYTESNYLEKDNIESFQLSAEYAAHFMGWEFIMDYEDEYYLTNDLLEEIVVDDITEFINRYITDENRFVHITVTNDDFDTPDDSYLIDLIDNIDSLDLEPFEEMIFVNTLMTATPSKLKIAKPKYNKTLGIYTWTLKNGATVQLKNTDFKDNEIVFRMARTGGMSQADDKIYFSALVSDDIIANSGIGNIDYNTLKNF